MCGIAGIFGKRCDLKRLQGMVAVQRHRGPDAEGIYLNPQRTAGLGHNRLSIIDLSDSGHQPMSDQSGTHWIVFNGEIYNYLELRRELESDYEFKTNTDTEVLLAAYLKWGQSCLDKLIGMFAFIIWNEQEQMVFAARDRFGVKPMYYHQQKDNTLLIASEIKAFHAAGIKPEFNVRTWATYFAYGLHDHSAQTFWSGINSLPPGHLLHKKLNLVTISRWYDIAERVGDDFDCRPETTVQDEYFELLKESVRMRFRADVSIGINLSGGVDSSALLALVHEVQGEDSDVKVFTFITGDKRYDELPWVRQMLKKTNHQLVVCQLAAKDVPTIITAVQYHQDEPFGGIPTLAYAQLFVEARKNGTIVLLDGNGMDEQWAGYDYYLASNEQPLQIIQGTSEKPVRPNCLTNEFRALAEPLELQPVFSDRLRNLQYRDIRRTKIPRVTRFNDRISMKASTELREPFLDHRLFELAIRQSPERKLSGGIQKKMLRQIAQRLIANNLSEIPKRPLQTPQREWLRGCLKNWADNHINSAVEQYGGYWLNKDEVLKTWQRYCSGESDNSFYVWQWINLSLMSRTRDFR